MDWKDKLIELLANSTIVQGMLTLIVVGAWLYIIIIGGTPPDGLTQIVGLVVGYYFGSKSQMFMNRMSKK